MIANVPRGMMPSLPGLEGRVLAGGVDIIIPHPSVQYP